MRDYYRYLLRGSSQGSLKSLLLEYINARNVTHIIFICFLHCGILIKYANTIKRFPFLKRNDKLFLFFSLFFFLLICNRAFANVSLVREDLMLLVFGGMVQLIHHVSLGNTKVWMISFCYYCKEMVGKYLLCWCNEWKRIS